LSAASKRISNILKKVEENLPVDVDASLLTADAERALYDEIQTLQPAIEAAMDKRDYAAAMQTTAKLRTSVDAFFDNVMVMDEDMALRHNRLALLHRVNTLCCATAELSLLRADETSDNAADTAA